MRGIRSFAAITLVTGVVVGCGSDSPPAKSRGEGDAHTTARALSSTAAVPDLVGLTEGGAARALDAGGLVLNVRYVDDAPRTASVLSSDPAAGTAVAAGSVVVVEVSYPPRLPLPRPEQESEIRPLSGLVARHPETFVGLYRGVDGAPRVVFGPGVDSDAWLGRLDEAAAGLTYPREDVGYGVESCPRAHSRLRAIQDEIAEDQSWHHRKGLAFGLWVQPETCTLRVESDLLRADEIEALIERYGTEISFNTTPGAHPVRDALTALPTGKPDARFLAAQGGEVAGRRAIGE